MAFLYSGIFSDIHMLALMYGGELCYWAWEMEMSDSKKREEEEKARQPGVDREPRRDRERMSNDSRVSSDCLSVERRDRGMGTAAAPPLFSSLILLLKGRGYLDQYCREFSAASVGQSLLTKYIKLAQGPLKSQNWNYARAVQLVVQLKRGGGGGGGGCGGGGSGR